MESGDENEFRESEWRRLLWLLDARVVPLSGVVIDLDEMRKKRAAIASMHRPQVTAGQTRNPCGGGNDDWE